MGNEADAEHVDTDWSGRPAARPRGRAELKETDGGAILAKREDGTWEPITDLVVKVINAGRRGAAVAPAPLDPGAAQSRREPGAAVARLWTRRLAVD